MKDEKKHTTPIFPSYKPISTGQLLLFLLVLSFSSTLSAASIGTWKNYLAYSEITDVKEGGNYLYVLASGSLFSYNTNDHSITTYDKATQLSDCNILLIEWCQAAKSLIIVYENGNIDLLSNSDYITNMPDYYNKSTTDDKTIYRVDVIGSNAYMSTGFGIVNINVADAEIANTYNLGFRVDYCYINGEYIYAASSTNGTYRALTSSNLIDPTSWTYFAAYTADVKTVDEDLLTIAETLNPGGPKYNYFFYMYFLNNRLYTSGGGLTSVNSAYSRPGCIQVLENDEWNIYQDDMTLPNDVSYLDVMSLAVDPSDPDHVYAGNIHCGLLEFENGKFVHNYTCTNSPLLSAVKSRYNYVRVDGLFFDSDKTLYMFNEETEYPFVELTSDDEWNKYNFSSLLYNGTGLAFLRNPIIDSRGYIWFVNNNWQKPALFCFQPEYSAMTEFSTLVNQNGTTISATAMSCVVEDGDGNMWVGTNAGLLELTTTQMSDNSLGFTQFIVPRDDDSGYGDYLLNGIDITAIAIDGAGRKWVGTNGNGVYLISEDNMTQEQHFLADDTPLLSNNIESIAIDGATGEVFFGTDNGLCSYTSDATTPSEEMDKDNVYAYPNPVKPNYTGVITIVGLSLDADVKIVTVNGSLVAEGRSNGGTFTWDGCDLDGKRVASGVYFVQTATSTGDKGTVCKVAVIR